MSSEFDDDTKKVLAALQKEYIASIPEKSSHIQKTIDLVIHSLGRKQAVDWKTLEHDLHKLSGSAGIYGFPELHAICKTLENMVYEERIQKLRSEDSVSFLRFWYAVFSEQALNCIHSRKSKQNSAKLSQLLEEQFKSKIKAAA